MTEKKRRHSFTRVGQFDLGKIGVSRFDIRDPYHLVVFIQKA